MRTAQAVRCVAVALVLAALLVGCAAVMPNAQRPSRQAPPTTPSTSLPDSSPTAPPNTPGGIAAVFVSVVDGDTIDTSAGTVRIIGIDTPERGECGHDGASAAIRRLLSAGDPVTLGLPAGQNDRDKYGRLIRYVTTDAGVDIGLMQVEEGNAVARYDSTDGYPAHPKEAAYHAAQVASLSPDGSVLTIACHTDAPPALAPSTDRWWEQYSSCSKLKRNDSGHPTGPFRRDDPAQAEIYDWFANGTGNHGDGDGDGLACE